jgi:NAD(P)-dependent dehydrogenase (short-subunit alcohol dehydrogenase family)
MRTPNHFVTGSTDGIGFQTALELARRGARVLVHGRTEAKATAAVARLGALHPASYVPVWGDLASLAQVRALAAQVEAQAPELDVLLHNAGVFTQTRQTSADGHELTVAVNHLAPFLLTQLLRGPLEAAGHARVINVSSMAHSSGRLDPDDFELARDWAPYPAYATSKLMNVAFTHELARRWATGSVVTHALHPGVISTKLLRAGFNMEGASLESGARTSVFCALDAQVGAVTGRYYSDAREARCARHANDEAKETQLWVWSARVTGAS